MDATAKIPPPPQPASAPFEGRGGNTPSRAACPALPAFIQGNLLEQELGELEFIVPQLIPEGLTLLVGKPKFGKSWLALELCLEYSRGGKVLDAIPLEQGTAVYFGLEDGPRRLQERLGQLTDSYDESALLIGSQGGLERLDRGGYEQLEGLLARRPDVKLIVIDTLGKFLPPSRSSNTYSHDTTTLGRLQALALEHHVAIVGIHHQRKGEAEDVFDTILGSTGVAGVADALLVLERKRSSGDDALLHATGRDIEEQQLVLSFDKGTCRWKLRGDAARFANLTNERQEVLELLESSETPLGPSDIAAKLGRDVGATKKLLGRMVSAQQLRKEGRGRYAPPEAMELPHLLA